MSPRWIIAAVAVVVLAGGTFTAVQLASDDDGEGTATTSTTDGAPTVDVDPGERREPGPTTSTSAEPAGAVSSIRLSTEPITTLTSPTDLATRAGDDALYVTEQAGRVVRVAGGTSTVLDISSQVGSEGNEQGLLGIEFSPDGAFVYLDYTDTAGTTRIVEYAMADNRPQADSRRELLAVEQPFSNHNAGAIEFGPDGFLYITLGDGGSGGDPQGNGQNRGTLLGSILRILPQETDGSPYAVPSDNPFVGVEGARDEIWAYGLRNPWRISFDRQTGDLWIGDVGQNEIEEIDFQPEGSDGGENYGWNRFEGTQSFQGSAPEDHVLPIHEYSHAGGNCSVTGGFVYRGEAIPELRGVYLFIDFCGGALMGLREEGGEAADVGDLGIRMNQVTSFGEDESGELYLLQRSGAIHRLQPA